MINLFYKSKLYSFAEISVGKSYDEFSLSDTGKYTLHCACDTDIMTHSVQIGIWDKKEDAIKALIDIANSQNTYFVK